MKQFIAPAILVLLTGFSSIPAQAAGAAADSVLCWSQLDLLNSRNKLTDDEQAVFKAQCTCMEQNERNGTDAPCAK